jgi:uncharacterized membrane protein YfcA
MGAGWNGKNESQKVPRTAGGAWNFLGWNMNLPYDLPWWGWAIGILAAIWIGISKTGIAGLGVLAVALFTLIFPARESTGIALPLLIVGDVMAVVAYRRHAEWSYLIRLAPFTVIGVFIGYFALGVLDAQSVGRLIGAILLVITGLQLWRLRSANVLEEAGEKLRHNLLLAALVGVLAGFFTMVSNAAGPITIVYFLAMGLPKIAFMGTSAWFYLILNTGKLPFSYSLGLLTPESLAFDLLLAPFVVIGGVAGYFILKRIDQRLFEQLALIFTAIAALRLLIG